MREGWEYKKLGEVAKVVTGATPKTNIKKYWGEGHYWVTPAEINEKNVYISETERQITDAALDCTKLQLLPKGTVLLSSRAPIGKVAICGVDMYCNQGFKNCICSDELFNKFLFYFLIYNKDYLNSLGRGATFKEISKSIVEKIVIYIPPFKTQLSIASELDKITEMISKYDEQLKELDKLSQSIFYEMFGDPVENEKGWEVKKLGEITDICTGSTPNRNNEDYYEGSIPWVKSTEVCNCFINITEEHITEEAINETNCKLFPKGTILMAMYGQGRTRGQIAILNIDATTNQAVAAILPNSQYKKLFMFQHLLVMYEKIRSLARGGNQANLNLTLVKSIDIILPPLPLQQSFASKIEAIEAMKSKVKEAKKEAETLLAARMQYWFE